MKLEKRFTELRQEGRVLVGTAIKYGDIATLPWGQERIEPGAFGSVLHTDAILNSQHDRSTPLARTGGGGLTLSDSPSALIIRAELPDTQPANDVLELVRKKVLRGISIEFKATAERQENDLRIIEKAELVGVAVVDSGAYPNSTVEARRGGRGGGRSFKSKIPYNKKLSCGCHRGNCKSVEIGKNAFDDAMIGDDEVLAIHGDYSRAIASKKRNTLRMKQTDDALEVEFDLPASTVADDLVGMHENVPLMVRPVFDQDASDFVEAGDVAMYSKMRLRAILIGATDADSGWPEAKLIGGKPKPKKRRLQRCLLLS